MACTLAESPSDPLIESSDSFVASAAVSIATGWSEPVPGRELHPLKSSAFHGALLRQLNFPGCHNVAVTELWNYSKWNIAGQRAAWCSHRNEARGCALWNRRDNQGVRLDRELCGTSAERNGGRPGEPLSENSAGLTHFAITCTKATKGLSPVERLKTVP